MDNSEIMDQAMEELVESELWEEMGKQTQNLIYNTEIIKNKDLYKHMKERDIQEIIWHLVSQGMGFQADKVHLEELEYSRKIAEKIIEKRILNF